MAKRTTDLLEVFQAKQGGGAARGGGKPRGRGGGTSRKSRAAKKRASFDGVYLNSRQVLLVSCVLVLLLVLSFTVGLGVGRQGDPSPGGPALSRPSAAVGGWYIRGKMPRHHTLSGRPIDPDKVHQELVSRHGFRGSDIRVDESGDHYAVWFGPFSTESKARELLERRSLEALPVLGDWPFNRAKVVRQAR